MRRLITSSARHRPLQSLADGGLVELPLGAEGEAAYKSAWRSLAARSEYVTYGQCADWLVRSALPESCDLMGLHEDAEWFRALPPIGERGRRGAVQGWSGAVARARTARLIMKTRWCDTVVALEAKGHPFRGLRFATPEPSDQWRAAIHAARDYLRPSTLWWEASRAVELAFEIPQMDQLLNPPYISSGVWRLITDFPPQQVEGPVPLRVPAAASEAYHCAWQHLVDPGGAARRAAHVEPARSR